MKGLPEIPNQKQILEKYNYLQEKHRPLTEQETSQIIQFCRFDPRLAETLVSRLSTDWKTLNPFTLNIELGKQPWPQALGPLAEFVKETLKSSDRRYFNSWMSMSLHNFPKAPYEQYFIGLRKFAGTLGLKDVEFSLSPYTKWGYFSREVLFNKALTHQRTRMTKKNRDQKLQEFIRTHKTFKVDDYIAFLGEGVSRRQAERDLVECNKLKAQGSTRARVYLRK